VPAEDDPIGPLARNGGDDIHHVERAERRFGGEGLLGRLHAGCGQLLRDVAAGGLERLGSGGAGAEADDLAEVFIGPAAVELHGRLGTDRRNRADHRHRRHHTLLPGHRLLLVLVG
jgi:hypothetical protein